ncbi:hypothetical protein BGZ65_006622, partial [Modicella reniformis]
MSPSYPSATTIRAVIRQFRNFLRDSTFMRGEGKKTNTTTTTTTTTIVADSLSSSSWTKDIEIPRARIWAQVIRGLIWLKQYRRARVTIHMMQKLGIKPTGYTWRTICRGWIIQGEIDRAESLAVKVFTDPTISYNYQQVEQPSFFTTKYQPSVITDFEEKQKHWSPMTPNSAPLFLIIQTLTKCGEMERARHWFDQIPEHEITDLLTSNMVAGYLRIGQEHKAQEVIQIMTRCGVKPTAIVFHPIVEHAAQNVSMDAAEDLVKDIVALGLFLNLFTYKILIRGYIAAGQRDEALKCLDRIRASGLETDRALGRILLDGLWGIGEPRKGDHGPPIIYPAVVANSGVEERQDEQQGGRLKEEEKEEDLQVVEKPGWSQRCVQWIQGSKYEQAEEALQKVLDSYSTRSDDLEIVHVIKALADHRALSRARYWLDCLVASNRSLDYDNGVLVDLMNHFVSGYIKAQQPNEAEAVIWGMSRRRVYPTVETANLMLKGTTLDGKMVNAEDFVQKMVESGISPNQQTYEILCRG